MPFTEADWANDETLAEHTGRVNKAVLKLRKDYPDLNLKSLFTDSGCRTPEDRALLIQMVLRKLLETAEKKIDTNTPLPDLQAFSIDMKLVEKLTNKKEPDENTTQRERELHKELKAYEEIVAYIKTSPHPQVAKAKEQLKKSTDALNPALPLSALQIYFERVYIEIHRDLGSKKVLTVKPLKHYLQKAELEFSSNILYDRRDALELFKEYFQMRIAKALAPDAYDNAFYKGIYEYPHHVFFRKLLRIWENDGWLIKDRFQFIEPAPDSPFKIPADVLNDATLCGNNIRRTLNNLKAQGLPPDPKAGKKFIIPAGANENVATTHGDRSYQQDTYFCARFLRDNVIDEESPANQLAILTDNDRRIVLWNFFAELQKKYGGKQSDVRDPHGQLRCTGATANIALAYGKKIYFANVGDTDTYLIIRKKDGSQSVIKALHTSDNLGDNRLVTERKSTLAMNRSIGDAEFESVGLSHHPHVVSVECAMEEGDSASIIHMTDGIRDSFPDDFKLEQHLSDIARNVYATEPDLNKQRAAIANSLVESAKASAIRIAHARHAHMTPKQIEHDQWMDNATVMVEHVDPDSISLTGMFDGHGGIDPIHHRDFAGEQHASKQLARGALETFKETLKKAYDLKKAYPRIPVKSEYAEKFHADVKPHSTKRVGYGQSQTDIAKDNREALGEKLPNTDTLNHETHLCSDYPILIDGVVSWTLTPQFGPNNNGFGMTKESQTAYNSRKKQIAQQLDAIAKDKHPQWFCLQSVDHTMQFSLPEKYTEISEGAFRTFYDHQQYSVDEASSKELSAIYLGYLLDDNAKQTTSDCHCLILTNKKTNERVLLVNAHFAANVDIETRARTLKKLSDEYGCTKMKIVGNFNKKLSDVFTKKLLDDHHFYAQQALESAVHFDFVREQQKALTAESGMIQLDKIENVETLTKYNLSHQFSAEILGQSNDYLSTRDKIAQLELDWLNVRQNVQQQSPNTTLSLLGTGSYEGEKAVMATVNNHKIYLTNKGVTHIEDVTQDSAYAALLMYIQATLIFEKPLPNGKTQTLRLAAEKNFEGKLIYPKEHPKAGEFISVSMRKNNSANANKILTAVANDLGLTVTAGPKATPSLDDKLKDKKKMPFPMPPIDDSTPGNNTPSAA